MLIEIILPFPSPDLSPNARLHWAKVAKAKSAYRASCNARALLALKKPWLYEAPYQLDLEFFKPTKRSQDLDNLLARMKSGIDGVCTAIGIDDKDFKSVTVSAAQDTGGFVKLRIFNLKEV